MKLHEALFALQDPAYRDFQAKLMPTVDPARIIGIRTPVLRQFAREFAKTPEAGPFLGSLPHVYYEENNLHAFLLEREGDFSRAVAAVDAFLPFVDNWATCDSLSPKVFAWHKPELLPWVRRWLDSRHEYAVRYGIGTLMRHYLDADFDPRYLDWVTGVCREAYYIKMMVAWYLATALAKQPTATLPVLESRTVDPWTHNKAIQKAVESYRIPRDLKGYLKTLKIK